MCLVNLVLIVKILAVPWIILCTLANGGLFLVGQVDLITGDAVIIPDQDHADHEVWEVDEAECYVVLEFTTGVKTKQTDEKLSQEKCAGW